MRSLFSVLIGFFAINANAEVFSFLSADPIVIVIQGADTDAKKFYDSLDVSPTEISSSVYEKKFDTPSDQITIGCRYAELSNSASCTIKIKHDSNLSISEEEKRAYLVSVKVEDTEFLFDRFVKYSSGKVPMYISEKQDLAYTSEVNRFILSYQNVD